MPATDTTAYPVLNAAELHAILAEIKADPKTWDQTAYARRTPCGTAYCVAGHAVHRAHPDAAFQFFLTNGEPTDSAWEVELADGTLADADDLARDLLGLTEDEAIVLFRGGNTLADLEHMVGVLTDPAYRRNIDYDEDAGEVTV